MSPLQQLLQQAYAQNQEAEAQRALELRMQGSGRGDYQNQSLEQMIAQATGQEFSPNLMQQATADPMSDVGGAPSLMDILRQFNAN